MKNDRFEKILEILSQLLEEAYMKEDGETIVSLQCALAAIHVAKKQYDRGNENMVNRR